MGVQSTCWICGARGGGQIALMPGGEADGRRVCNPCVRRLIAGAAEEQGRAAWRRTATEDVGPAAAVVIDIVRRGLPQASDPDKLAAATAYLELGLVDEALEALAAVADPPGAVHGCTHRALTSFLTRLLDPTNLADGSGEALRARVQG